MITRRELTTYLTNNDINPDTLNSVQDLPDNVIIELHKMTAGPGERVYNVYNLNEFKQDNHGLTELDYLRLGSHLQPLFESYATSFIYHYDENEDENIITLFEGGDDTEIHIKAQVARLLYDMELIDN